MIRTPVTILDTETTSSTIDTLDTNVRLSGLIFPTLVGATTFSLTMSINGTDFFQVLNSSGAAISFTILATGNCYVPIEEVITSGIRYFKVVMAGAVSADRIITPVVQRQMYS